MKKNISNIMNTQSIFFNSWEIYGDKIAIKKTDKSFFEYHGSGIPKKTKYFWGIDNLKVGERKFITLRFLDINYGAYFEVINTSSQQARIFWSTELYKLIKKIFPNYSQWDRKDLFPYLRFEKETYDVFKISFLSFNNDDEENDQWNESLSGNILGKTEGQKKEYLTTRYERNRQNRELCIKLFGTNCYVCGFDFERAYGNIGCGFIEVHHRTPLHNSNGEVAINPMKDLIPLCSNCHRMIHRKKDEVFSVEELKDIYSKNMECK